MPRSEASPAPEVECDPDDRVRHREYGVAFRRFAQALPAQTRAKINGSGSPDWQSSRTFALPVNADSLAYRTDEPDPVIETLNEIGALRGALPKIALWLADRSPGAGAVGATAGVETFRMAVARICEAIEQASGYLSARSHQAPR